MLGKRYWLLIRPRVPSRDGGQASALIYTSECKVSCEPLLSPRWGRAKVQLRVQELLPQQRKMGNYPQEAACLADALNIPSRLFCAQRTQQPPPNEGVHDLRDPNTGMPKKYMKCKATEDNIWTRMHKGSPDGQYENNIEIHNCLNKCFVMMIHVFE
ncbi:hypothetical protein NDU88_004352 [Pleurodeles waltl]|uniref:Uncharacterized protein n=1 Tax=Pleurodeles waltl TaxID=8319 RepID=A0AAV7UIZ3_PLEWA|nr:hypothetical protein NDU88_004352 [Pleurodeles waltl]